jgi:hypothetical protein
LPKKLVRRFRRICAERHAALRTRLSAPGGGLRLQRPAGVPALRLHAGLLGYGGRRYYDKYGNYTKYGQGDIPEGCGESGLIEKTAPRSHLR